MSNTPLPAPWDYCYEWDGPFGTRKFSAASHNGSRPDRSVPIYTPDQMHTHAAAVTAAKDAEIAGLRAELLKSLADNAALRERVKVLEDALLRVARMAEALKKDCGMDPESPQAVRNGQYMNISYAARAALEKP